MMSILSIGVSDGITSASSIKPRCSTPATMNGLPLSTMVFPTIPGSALNRRFQTRSLRTATSGLPGLSSSGRSKRPSRGFAPSISKRLDCVRAPKIRSDCSRHVNTKVRLCASAICSKEWFSFWMSMYWPGDGQSRRIPIAGECSHTAASRSGWG